MCDKVFFMGLWKLVLTKNSLVKIYIQALG